MRAKAAKICTDTSIIAFAYSYDDLRLRVLELSQVKLIVANAYRIVCVCVRSSVQLYEHQNLHFAVRPFVCACCERRFASGANYRAHGKQHQLLESKCHLCGAQLASPDEVRVHLPYPYPHTTRAPPTPRPRALYVCLFFCVSCFCFCVSFPLLLSLDMRTYTM